MQCFITLLTQLRPNSILYRLQGAFRQALHCRGFPFTYCLLFVQKSVDEDTLDIKMPRCCIKMSFPLWVLCHCLLFMSFCNVDTQDKVRDNFQPCTCRGRIDCPHYSRHSVFFPSFNSSAKYSPDFKLDRGYV